MAAEIGSVYVALTLEAAQHAAGWRQQKAVAREGATDIAKSVGVAHTAVDRFNKSVRGSGGGSTYQILAAGRAYESVGDRIALLRSIALSTTAVMGGFGAALASNIVLRYADSAQKVANSIRVIADNASDARAQLTAVYATADRARVGVSSTSQLYTRLQRYSPETSPDVNLRRTETIQKALALGGATQQERESTSLQFSQGFASGNFQGDELRAIRESPLGGVLAKGLGVKVGDLKQMGAEGKLTAAVVAQALDKMAGDVDRAFALTATTVDQAFAKADNAITAYVGSADKAYGLTRLLAAGVDAFGSNVDSILPGLTRLAALVGAIFLSRGIQGAGGNVGKRISDELKARRATVEAEKQQAADLIKQRDAAQKDLEKAQAATRSGDSFAAAPRAAQDDYERRSAAAKKAQEAIGESVTKRMKLEQDLAQLTAKSSMRAIALSEEQVQAENRAYEASQRQYDLQREINRLKGVRTFQTGKGDIEGQKATTQEINDRRRQMAAAEREEAKQLALASTKGGQVGQSSDADKKDATKRIEILRQIGDAEEETARRTAAANMAATGATFARTTAMAKGQGVLRGAIEETTGALGRIGTALKDSQDRLMLSARAATFSAASWTVLKGAAVGLWGALGGTAGVAITGAIVALGYLGARAAESAQKISEVRRGVMEDLEAMGQDGGRQAGAAQKSVTEQRIDELEKTLKQRKDRITGIVKEIDDIPAQTQSAGGRGGGNTGAIESRKEAMEQVRKIFADLSTGKITKDSALDAIDTLAEKVPAVRAIAATLRESAMEMERTAISTEQVNKKIAEAREELAKMQAMQVQGTLRPLYGYEKQANAMIGEPGYTGPAPFGPEDPAAGAAIAERQIALSERSAKQKDIEARAEEMLKTARSMGVEMSEEYARSVAATTIENEKAAAAQDALAKKIVETASATKAASASSIDQKVLESIPKDMADTAAQVDAYLRAVESGDWSKAPKGLKDLRDVLEGEAIAAKVADLVKEYGYGADAASKMEILQKALNQAVAAGAITAVDADQAFAGYIATLKKLPPTFEAYGYNPQEDLNREFQKRSGAPADASERRDDKDQAADQAERLRLAKQTTHEKQVEAEANKIVNDESEKHRSISLEQARIDAEAIVTAQESVKEAKKSTKEVERSAEIIDRIRRGGEAAFLPDIDREVIEQTKRIQGAAEKARAYIDAINSGDMSKAPKELLDVRAALLAEKSAETYRDIIGQFGNGKQLAQQFSDQLGILNGLVASGAITADQAAKAWERYTNGFGNNRAMRDAVFDAQQLRRSTTEQSVYSTLQGAGMLTNGEIVDAQGQQLAAQIRINEKVKEWQGYVEGTGKSYLETIEKAGGFKDTFKASGKFFSEKALDIANDQFGKVIDDSLKQVIAKVIDPTGGLGLLKGELGSMTNPMYVAPAPGVAAGAFGGLFGLAANQNIAPGSAAFGVPQTGMSTGSVPSFSGSGGAAAAELLRGFEGYRSKPYWDVNALRTGYGSDTVTNPNTGAFSKVTAMTSVDKSWAEADLARRVADTQAGIAKDIGPDAWGRLTPNAQGALTSTAYNYGSLPDRVIPAAQSGDPYAISNSIRGLAGDNGGVNSSRRNAEADFATATTQVQTFADTTSKATDSLGGLDQNVNQVAQNALSAQGPVTQATTQITTSATNVASATATTATAAQGLGTGLVDAGSQILGGLGQIGTGLFNAVGSIFKGLGTGGGGIISSILGIFGGARAAGGRGIDGKLHLVGEHGPELLKMDGAGTFYSSAQSKAIMAAPPRLNTSAMLAEASMARLAQAKQSADNDRGGNVIFEDHVGVKLRKKEDEPDGRSGRNQRYVVEEMVANQVGTPRFKKNMAGTFNAKSRPARSG